MASLCREALQTSNKGLALLKERERAEEVKMPESQSVREELTRAFSSDKTFS